MGDDVSIGQQGPADGSTAAPNVETAAQPDTDASRSLPEPEGMDTVCGPNLPAGKRPHERILTQATQQKGSGGDRQPPKAPGIRRPTFKSRPNITVDSRQAAQPSTSSSVPEGERDKQQFVEASKDQHEPVNGVDAAPTGRDTPPDVQPPVSVNESGEECMDVSRGKGSPMAGKRSHESTVNSEPQRDDGGGGEPPKKTPVERGSAYRSRPNIPGEPRRAGNPPS
ncbi:hypothetical protein HPB50_029400 [Hyalomma asiaticum]|nr:hypothetical protein HPB50_029400 [Hyalomma asiaticum]